MHVTKNKETTFYILKLVRSSWIGAEKPYSPRCCLRVLHEFDQDPPTPELLEPAMSAEDSLIHPLSLLVEHSRVRHHRYHNYLPRRRRLKI